MKWSRFTVFAEKQEQEKCLLYNTFHDSQILCDDKKMIHHLREKIIRHQNLNEEEEQLTITLKDLGFVVEDEIDEKEEFLAWFEEKVRNNYEQLSSLILTSRTCNLRCPYCFEKDVLAKGLNMSRETALQVIKWNKERIDKYHPKIMDITFFGGEPLMNVPILELIAGEMQDYCSNRNVHFEFGIITNGVMLTPELVLRLKPMGLKWVKITLDGDQHDHDQLRVTATGQGTFAKIWSNLENIKGLIPIYLGGNFNMENQESLNRLVDKLSQASFRENIFSVEFKPIQVNQKGNYKPSPIRTDFAEPAFEPGQIEVMMNARNYIHSKNLPGSTQIGIGPCELHRKSFFGIDMNGKLYKCSAMVGREEFASGDIWKGEDLEKVDERIGTGIRPWKDCGDCPFIPVCAGGCKAVGYDRYGDFTIGSCDIKFFKRMVNEMFERNLEEITVYEDGLHTEHAPLSGAFPLKEMPAVITGASGGLNGDTESFAV